jgi:hypothetical protein
MQLEHLVDDSIPFLLVSEHDVKNRACLFPSFLGKIRLRTPGLCIFFWIQDDINRPYHSDWLDAQKLLLNPFILWLYAIVETAAYTILL